MWAAVKGFVANEIVVHYTLNCSSSGFIATGNELPSFAFHTWAREIPHGGI